MNDITKNDASTDIIIDDKKVIYKDSNGDFVFNLMKDFKVDDKQIKSLIIIGLKTAQDYRKTADIANHF